MLVLPSNCGRRSRDFVWRVCACILVGGLAVGLLVGVVGAASSGSPNEAVFPAAAEPSPDANLTAGGTFWQGQQVSVRAGPDAAGDVYQLRRYEDDAYGALVTEFVLDEEGAAILDTANLSARRYVILDDEKNVLAPNDGHLEPAADEEDAWWEIANQTLRVSAETHTHGEPVAVAVESNRGRYPLRITSPDLDATDLASVVGEDAVTIHPDADAVTLPVTADTTLTLAFEDVPPGEYTFDFSATDTPAADDTRITVQEPAEFAQFGEEVMHDVRGEVSTIRVDLDDTDTARLRIGSADLGYAASLTVVDGSGDGSVELAINTYLAGRAPDDRNVFWTVDDGDELREVVRHTEPRESVLASGDYPVWLSVGDEETDIATLVLSEATFGALETRVAPELAIATEPALVDETSTARELVAVGDALVLHADVSGLGGLFGPGYERADDPVAAEHGLSLDITPQNGDGPSLNLSSVEAVPAPDGGVFFVLEMDPARVGVEPGSEYQTTLTLREENPLVDTRVSNTTTFTVAERAVTFDDRDGDLIPLRTADRLEGIRQVLELSGAATVAPGTELVVILRSDEPFHVESQPVVVADDGTWSAEFDPPDEADRFMVHVRDGPRTVSDRVIAEVVEADDDEPPGDGDSDEGTASIHPVFLGIGAIVLVSIVLFWYREAVIELVETLRS